jgi:hypothetical protein
MEQEDRLQHSDGKKSCGTGAEERCVVMTWRMELLIPRASCRVGDEAEAGTFRSRLKDRAPNP